MEIPVSQAGLDFMNDKCLAFDPNSRPTARELMIHPWILEEDRGWTFEKSKIGKAVAKRAPKTIKT